MGLFGLVPMTLLSLGPHIFWDRLQEGISFLVTS